MPNVTVICLLFSLLSYGMGFSKTLILNNSAEPINTYAYINVSLAAGYYVLAIFFSVIGCFFYFVKKKKARAMTEVIKSNSKRNSVGNRMIMNVRAS